MRHSNTFLPFALLGCAALLVAGPTPAQTRQNAPPAARLPAPSSTVSFADLVSRLSPAVVNISTRQTVRLERRPFFPPGFEDFFRQFGVPAPDQGPRTRQ